MQNINKQMVVSVAIGILLSSLVIWFVYSFIQTKIELNNDTVVLQQIVNLINKNAQPQTK